MTPRQMRLTHWDGPLPECGEYLQAPSGTTYAVLSMRRTRPGSKSVATVQMLRLAPEDIEAIPADASMHYFVWNSRTKRGKI